MTFKSNQNETIDSSFNPFLSTVRDIERTEELAEKNLVITGFLSFFFLPVAMIYLNRGINNLKILIYLCFMALMVAAISHQKSNKEIEARGNFVGKIGAIVITFENTRAVSLARKRQSETKF